MAGGGAVVFAVAHSEKEGVTWTGPGHQRVVTVPPFDKTRSDTWDVG
jgi:hypothetical protein